MKKSIFAIIIAIIAVTAGEGRTRVIENPDYSWRDQAFITVTGIEQTPDTTRLRMHAVYRPHNWIKISSEGALIDPDNDTQYPIIGAEGITLGSEFFMPDNGEADFTLLYHAVPENVKAVDFKNDSWHIYGIRLDGDKADKLPCIDPKQWLAEHEKPYPGEPAEFFKNGNAMLSGRINGYSPEMAFDNLLIYSSNPLTGVDTPINVPVNDDGTFDAVIPIVCPGFIYLSGPCDMHVDLYLEPGKNLDMLLDWEDIVNGQLRFILARTYKLEKTEFGGELGTINRELAAGPDMDMKYDYDMPETHTWSKMLATVNNQDDERQQQIDEYAASHPTLNPITVKLLKNNASGASLAKLMEHEMRLNSKIIKLSRQNANLDSLPPSLQETLTPGYYTRLKDVMIADDPWFLANRSMSILPNRLAFCNMFILPAMQALVATSASDSIFKQDDSREQANRAKIIKAYTEKENLPLLWQAIIAAKLCSWSGVDPSMITKEEAFSMADEWISLIENPFIATTARNYVENMFNRLPYELPDNENADIIRKIIAPHAGKVLLIDFWGTTCMPCRYNIEQTAALREANKDHSDFKFIFVTGEEESPKAAYDSYVEANLKGMETHRVSASDFSRLRDLFNFAGIPHYVLIGRNGEILNDDFAAYFLEDYLKRIGITLNH